MKPGLPNNFILNGFDRSGSSAIARTLARHPDIELIMQPFNSGPVRAKLNRVLGDGNTEPADFAFFQHLENGELQTEYIQSRWHEKFSTVKSFVPGRLHVIKTTQNHLAIEWARRHFPKLEHWGIWREPMDILGSLVRNGFHIEWYAGHAVELARTVREHPTLARSFEKYIDAMSGRPVREMAFIIAVRSGFYFSKVEQSKVVRYEDFVRDNNSALQPVIEYFGLAPFDFGTGSTEDLNIVGKKYRSGRTYIDVIPAKDRNFCDAVFASLSFMSSEQ